MKVETPPAQWHRDASVHDALNDQIICQAVEDQLARPTQAAQDGTTFRSQASRHQRFHQTRLRKRKAIVEVRENAKKMKTKRRDENTDAGTIGPMIDLLAPVGENSLSETRRAQNKSPKRFDREKFQWRESEQTFTCPAGHKLDYKTKERLPRHGGRHVISRHYQCAPRHCLACPLAAQFTTNPARARKVKRMDGQELIDAQRKKMSPIV